MSYEPKPVDTSQIDLREVDGLDEYLAEQAHEIWAQRKMSQGWKYGPVLDEKLQHHPDLKKYSELPESEKVFDREMSSHTLKLIRHHGFQLVREDPQVAALRGEGPHPLDKDDMLDGEELKWLRDRIDTKGEKALEPLADRLKCLGDELLPSYLEANAAAGVEQKKYLQASFRCLVSAALAVFLAIYQLADFPRPPVPLLLPLVELALVLYAVSLVVRNFQSNWKDSWLTNRSRAERLRSLKFRTLLDPDFWSPGTLPNTLARVRGEVGEIDSMSPQHLWARLADADLDFRVPDRLSGDPETDHAIGNYYLRRRLGAQLTYFRDKVHDYEHKDHKTKIVGPLLFFGVLLFVFAHDVVDLVQYLANHGADPTSPAEQTGRLLIALAAVLPAASAAVHVYRDGREAGRNHLRMVATKRRLTLLNKHLEAQQTRKEQIRLMVETELVLAAEHEQWLQLMKECEWYG